MPISNKSLVSFFLKETNCGLRRSFLHCTITVLPLLPDRSRVASVIYFFFLSFFKELKNFTQLNGLRSGFVTGWNRSLEEFAH